MENIEKRIEEIEKEMSGESFWENKDSAQQKVQELGKLKADLAKEKGYDKGSAIITIFSGAGGVDAEDFTRMLYEMYDKYLSKKSFSSQLLHISQNDHKGIKNVVFEVDGKGAYGILKNESGVHRLVRQSPFSAKSLRHTSFAMVEVVPKFEKGGVVIADDDLKIDFTKSSGPGGQNVNKRETAVRVTHLPTGLTVHCESGRSQVQNKEKALEVLRGKLYKLHKESTMKDTEKYYISKTTEAEWGNQIRSYVLHPYKLIKDHRTGVEHKDPNGVLGSGELDIFIEAERGL